MFCWSLGGGGHEPEVFPGRVGPVLRVAGDRWPGGRLLPAGPGAGAPGGGGPEAGGEGGEGERPGGLGGAGAGAAGAHEAQGVRQVGGRGDQPRHSEGQGA